MAVYTNDLRLKEIATGDESGTWGTSTNTNLSLIAEAFSFGTEAITTNADTHTTTIADGSTDPGRSIFLKYTGTLDSACTITIGPNTVSKLWLIENATSGGFSIIIKQGSGATITIPNGQTKAIYSDGAGSGGAMVDAFQDLSIPDLFVDDDLTIGDDLVFSSDSAVITFGADGDTTLTHTDGSGLTLNSTNKLMFNDASQFIQGSSATVLSLGATDEIDLTATAIDINGTLDVSGTTAFGGAVTITETGSGSAAGPFLNLFRDSSSPADGDDIGIIQFRGDDDAGNATTYASVSASIHDASNTTEDGRFNLNTMVAGSSVSRMYMVPTATTFNDGGGDIDFRVESTGNTHMLFVDAGADTVVIGSGSITAPSTVDFLSYASAAAGRSAFVHGSGDGGVVLSGTGSGSAASLIFGNNWGGDGSGFTEEYRLIMDGSDDSLQFKYNGNASTALTLSSAGAATFGGTVTANAGVVVDNITIDGTEIDLSSGSLTLDVAGGITLDADGGQVDFKDGGTLKALIDFTTDNVEIQARATDGDLIFRGQDGGSFITALTLDMSAAGRAIFGADADMSDGNAFRFGDSQDLLIYHSSNENIIQANTTDQDLIFKGVDGGSSITALTLDMSEGGAATFRGNMTMNGIAGTSPILNLVNNDTEDVNTGRESSVRFNGFRSGGEAVVNSQISGNHTSSADDDKGGLFFYTNGGSGLGERMRITSNEIIVNEDGGDQDFRIESQASTLGISLDASTGHVSMGVTNATTTYGGTFRLLQIGNGAGYGIFNGLTTATANDSGVASFFGQTSGTSGYDVVGGMRIALAADSSSNSEGKIEFYTATGGNLVEAMEITNSQQLILHGVKNDTTSDAANMNIRTSDGLVRRSTSSRRYKNTITDATHGLTELLSLRPVTYKGNNDGDRLFGGLIAEEVHDAGLTEFVQYNSDDEPDALAYGHMVSLCIKAIQEQQALIETLQAEVAALKGE